MPTNSVFRGTIWRQVRAFSDSLLNTVLPPVCAGCGKVGDLVCAECRSLVQWVREPVCFSCGKPSEQVLDLCDRCNRHPLAITHIRAAALHLDPVRRILHHMKYEGYFALAEPLAGIMIRAWPKWRMDFDIVVPIPLHSERERQRGYNQAEHLVSAIQKELNWNSVPEALHRHKRTTPQVGLTLNQRMQNVQGAFAADAGIVSGQKILLVDDVCTTGATLDAAARVLLEAGAASVAAYCLTTVSGTYDISHF